MEGARKENCRLRFAGFVPFTWRSGQWWFLLGREADGWGVFGGGPENSDPSASHVAVREAREESHGLLLEPALWQGCRRGPLLLTPHAVIYGVPIPWRLKRYMNRVLLPQAELLPSHGCFEKKEVKWFPMHRFCAAPASKTIGGRKLRVPLPFTREVSCSLVLAWTDFDDCFWNEGRLCSSVSAMDEECFGNEKPRLEDSESAPPVSFRGRCSVSQRRRGCSAIGDGNDGPAPNGSGTRKRSENAAFSVLPPPSREVCAPL